MAEVERVRVRVSGRVQGVWFRASTKRTAEKLGLNGWVRNLPDGRVEAAFEGSRPAIDAAVAWCAEGSEHASVDTVESVWEKPEGLSGFQVR